MSLCRVTVLLIAAFIFVCPPIVSAGPEREVPQYGGTVIVERVPHICLPTVAEYAAWWPYIKNYYGELTTGATRSAPIYARMWIDQKLKQELGC